MDKDGKKENLGYRLDPTASAAVAKRFSEKMAEDAVTQTQLAAKTGMPQGLISNLLNGVRPLHKSQIVALATALGLTEEDVVPPGVFPGRDQHHAPATGVSDPDRKLQASKESFLAKFTTELAPDDVKHLAAVTFLRDSGVVADDEYWWDIVASGRRRRERARVRRGGSSSTTPGHGSGRKSS